MIMGLFSIFDIAGSAMSAQTVRLNSTASNLANADSVSGTEEGVYRARRPVFATFQESLDRSVAGVRVTGIVEDARPAQQQYQPDHPLANTEGYIYRPNINVVEEMADMISASRTYQNNVEVVNTSKQMLMNLLRLGQ
jgi:flagellar basal-body rod protein FlgC